MPSNTLTVHIGLPKTATTFLQHLIFKPVLKQGFLHRTRSDRARRICRLMKEIGSGSVDNLPGCFDQVRTLLLAHQDKVAAPSPIVVSDENISGQAAFFWRGKDIGPAALAQRLGELRRVIADEFPVFRVIVGVRRQDQWLASRYAESSTVFKSFCQSDFESRIGNIIAEEPFSPGYEWLDFFSVYEHFKKTLGDNNVLMLSMERLRKEPTDALAEVGRFVGVDDIERRYEELVQDNVRTERNVLSTGSNEWQLRRDESVLTLSRELQSQILERVSKSNRMLGNALPLCFDY